MQDLQQNRSQQPGRYLREKVRNGTRQVLNEPVGGLAKRRKNSWTREEDLFLKTKYRMFGAEFCALNLPGRSVTYVKSRAFLLDLPPPETNKGLYRAIGGEAGLKGNVLVKRGS